MKKINLIMLFAILSSILFVSCGDMDYAAKEVKASDSYSSTEADYNENNRKIVKTASINLEVKELEPSIIELKNFLKPIKGYVYNYEISNESYQQDSYQKNMDSTVYVEKIYPKSELSIRIPIQYADSFINYFLQQDVQITALKIHDEDVTENMWQKNEVAKVYTKSGKAQHGKKSVKNIAYDKNTSIDGIKAKARAASLNYKTKYLWFDLNMKARAIVKTKIAVTDKNYRTPVHIAFANASITGWHICEDIILGLVTIWPIIVLLTLIYFIVRKYKIKSANA